MLVRKAKIFVNTVQAGYLLEKNDHTGYLVEYLKDYKGPPISLTMPINQIIYEFSNFPPFFDGLLPEGQQLEALLRQAKLDRTDYFAQLMTIGKDLIGSVTVIEELNNEKE